MSDSPPVPPHALPRGSEMAMRVLFGLFLAVVAVVLDFVSPVWFAVLVVLVALPGAREWHRMVRSDAGEGGMRPIHVQTGLTTAAVALSVTLLQYRLPVAAFGALAVGAACAYGEAARRNDNPAWHALGLIYLGIPALALVALRSLATQGALTMLGLFLIVWSTDTGALVFGKLIGGRKLAPRLSPGKTWAGTIGGSVTAALVFACYIGFFGFNMVAAGIFAFFFSAAAHSGDLLESAIKRHFGRKDSGGMIPGHGGVLDRMDSTFAAGVVLALLVFVLHLNPMFGGRV